MVVDGPHGRCQVPGSGDIVVSGGASFGDGDACSFYGPPDSPPSSNDGYCADPACLGPQSISMLLPYERDGSHLRPFAFSFSAQWLCSDSCPTTRTFTFEVDRFTRDPGFSFPLGPPDHPATEMVKADYTFSSPNGGFIPIVRFDGQGHCEFLVRSAQDCSA